MVLNDVHLHHFLFGLELTAYAGESWYSDHKNNLLDDISEHKFQIINCFLRENYSCNNGHAMVDFVLKKKEHLETV